MFNLEQAITKWRQQMLAAGIQTPVPLEELESHLRDEIEQRLKAGLSESRAFEVAVRNVGGAQGVRAEFAKIGEPGTAREQMALVAAALIIPAGMAGSVWHHRAEMTTGQLMASLSAMATFAGLVWAGRLGYRRFPVIGSKRTREVIGCAAVGVVVLWWGVFLRVIAPRYDYTMMGFLVALLWAFFAPAGVWLGLVFGLERAARTFSTTDGGKGI
jgi:hypothetical protein